MPRVPEWSRCPLLRRLLGCFEIGEEAIDDSRRTSVVGEGLSDHTAGEVDGQRADLAAQRDESGLTLGLDLRVRGRREASSLGGGGLPGFGDDLLAVLTGGLTDVTGLGACLRQLAGV